MLVVNGGIHEPIITQGEGEWQAVSLDTLLRPNQGGIGALGFHRGCVSAYDPPQLE